MRYQTITITHILSFCQVSFNGKIPNYSIFYNVNSWKEKKLETHGNHVIVFQL